MRAGFLGVVFNPPLAQALLEVLHGRVWLLIVFFIVELVFAVKLVNRYIVNGKKVGGSSLKYKDPKNTTVKISDDDWTEE